VTHRWSIGKEKTRGSSSEKLEMLWEYKDGLSSVKWQVLCTIDLLTLHELVHHCCPFPLSVPPPRTWRRSTPSNVIHSCRPRSSQTDRLGGASSVPLI
jgi:hypothetical protein